MFLKKSPNVWASFAKIFAQSGHTKWCHTNCPFIAIVGCCSWPWLKGANISVTPFCQQCHMQQLNCHWKKNNTATIILSMWQFGM